MPAQAEDIKTSRPHLKQTVKFVHKIKYKKLLSAVEAIFLII
jgi:hypothetical protein